MQPIQLNSDKSLRFRKWSRDGYAVFRSLGSCVSIGVLSSKICNQSLLKTQPQLNTNQNSFVLNNSVDDNTEFETELIFENLIISQLIEQSKNDIQNQQIITNNNHPSDG